MQRKCGPHTIRIPISHLHNLSSTYALFGFRETPVVRWSLLTEMVRSPRLVLCPSELPWAAPSDGPVSMYAPLTTWTGSQQTVKTLILFGLESVISLIRSLPRISNLMYNLF